MSNHIVIGLTEEEATLIDAALRKITVALASELRDKIARLAEREGWVDDHDPGNDWADGHPLDFGDR